MTIPKTLYKIMNKNGQFSSGGHPPKWVKSGKIWELTHLKAHLTLIGKYSKNLSVYQDCTLVEFKAMHEPATLLLSDLLKEQEEKMIVDKLRKQG